MSNRARQIPWLRVFVEGVVIVGSILLAFGIEAWWTNKQERDQEARVLGAVLVALRNNTEHLDFFTSLHEQQLARVVVLLDAAANGGSGLSADSLDHLLAGLSGATIPVYERGALDAALASLDLIENRVMRRRLAQLSRRWDELSEFEKQEAELVRDLWMPLVRARTYLPQLSNIGRARISEWEPSEIPVDRAVDHTALLTSDELVNVLVQRQWVHEDILLRQASVRAFLNGLVNQLE